MSETTKTKEQLKEEFIKNRGYWSKCWEDVLELDSNFFSTYSRFSSVPSKNNALSPKIREFIYIAIDASTTHLYLPGLKLHMENALALGATRDEIMEVLELTSVLGIHTCTMGVPILMDELRKMGRGDEVDNIEYGDHEKALKESFIKNRGYWSPFWDDMLKLSPEFFECYLDFSSVPWKSGTLEPKVKEFIYIAIDSSSFNIYSSFSSFFIFTGIFK